MEKIFYAVRVLMNGRQGCLPSTFESKGDALMFANTLATEMEDTVVKVEIHVYEVKEIDCHLNKAQEANR